MDNLDKKILTMLSENARITVKELSEKVNLTSPAVSERIKRLEKNGIIGGYTVRFNPEMGKERVRAMISISVEPEQREDFIIFLNNEDEILHCYKVTGEYSHMVKINCRDISSLESLIGKMQRFGQTNTQIILSEIEKTSLSF